MYPYNKRRINQVYKSGQVNINGRLSRHDMAARYDRMERGSALSSGESLPYFGPPTGLFARSFNIIDEGEIVFRNRNYTVEEMARDGSVPPGFDDSIAVDVASTLNLLGQKSRTVAGVNVEDSELREEIAHSLQILGFALTENRKNNESNVTIMIGGIHTTEHNGTKPIECGAWVMGEVPSNGDVPHDRFGLGGKDYPDETQGGRVTLRLAPYDKTIHKLTPQRIFNCLQAVWDSRAGASKAFETYLHSYIESAIAMQHSLLRIVAAGCRALIDTDMLVAGDKLKSATDPLEPSGFNTDPKRSAKERIGALLMAQSGKRGVERGNVTLHQRAVLESVFLAYTTNGIKTLKTEKFAPDAAGGIGLYMVCAAEHVRIVLERVIGRALHGAAPGTDVDIAMTQPSR